jgi:predicted O-methyltransferase YrrM
MIPTFDQVMLVTSQISASPALEDTEAKGLYDCLALVPYNGIVIEVGCQLGRSSSIIAQLASAIGFHAIHIDPYTDDPEYLPRWVEMMRRVNSQFVLACMMTEQTEWLLPMIGGIDLAFIDGDHEAIAVTTDLMLVAEQLRSGGYLCCHDYGNPGLLGVAEAVDEYIADSLIDPFDAVGVFGSLGVWKRR